MELLHSYSNEHEMLDNPPYAYWLDHALIDRRGANLTLNGHYLGALEDFAKVLHWLNDESSAIYSARADVLRKSLRQMLWDDEAGLFADALIDGRRSNRFSEHANAMALAMGIANSEQARRVAEQLLIEDDHNFIKRSSGVIMVTPAMSYFLHKSLCEAGYIDESLALFRNRFERMLESNTNGTLWEEWWLDGTGRSGKFQGGRTRSDAQTESAFPPALFAEYLLGLSIESPGMDSIVVSRQDHSLKHLAGIVPTPHGQLEVAWQIGQDSSELILNILSGIRLGLDIESLDVGDGQQIRINGKAYDKDLGDNLSVILSSGWYVVLF